MQIYARDLIDRQEEIIEFSDVSWTVYGSYFRASGRPWIWIVVLLLLSASFVVTSLSDWWLGQWSMAAEHSINMESNRNLSDYLHNSSLFLQNNLTEWMEPMYQTFNNISTTNVTVENDRDSPNERYYLCIYVALVATAWFFGWFATSLFHYITMLVSRTIHAQVFLRMTRAPVRFFDSTPRGHIVSRFSGDMECIDKWASEVLHHTFRVGIAFTYI